MRNASGIAAISIPAMRVGKAKPYTLRIMVCIGC